MSIYYHLEGGKTIDRMTKDALVLLCNTTKKVENSKRKGMEQCPILSNLGIEE
jgi:hypothetical protein